MIRKYRECKTIFIQECSECHSKFTYSDKDPNSYSKFIRCPYCNLNQPATFNRFWLIPRKYKKVVIEENKMLNQMQYEGRIIKILLDGIENLKSKISAYKGIFPKENIICELRDIEREVYNIIERGN